jgi:hypothetical protein
LLNSKRTWEILVANAPRNEWLDLSAIYEIVRARAELEDQDVRPVSSRSNSPRWQRSVRNVLQRRKVTGEIEWDGSGRFRFPQART